MDQVIANYQMLSSLTGQMRLAAEQGEWDRLVALEQGCSQLLESLQREDARTLLDDSSRLRKETLIRQILADHVEIRNLTEPWMAQLQRTLHSAGQEQRLQQAYSDGQ